MANKLRFILATLAENAQNYPTMTALDMQQQLVNALQGTLNPHTRQEAEVQLELM